MPHSPLPLLPRLSTASCLLMAVLLSAMPCSGQSAAADGALGDGDRGHWCVGLGGGFLMPHRMAMRALINGHAERAEITWSASARGMWANYRQDPSWGMSLHWASTGADVHVGHQVVGLAFADLNIRGRLHVRLGGGLGWTSVQWDAATPEGRESVVIGSPINGAAQLGLHVLPARRPAPWHRRIGLHLRLDHQSNASFTQPNLGTNVVTLGLSTPVRSTSPWRSGAPADTLIVLSLLPGPVKGFVAYGMMGRRQPSPLAGRETVGECGVDWRFGGRGTYGFVLGGLAMVRPETWGTSIHGGFQLRFTRVQLDLLHGRYLNRWQLEEPHYNRVVLGIHLRQGWWSRIVLHTHGFRAHHPAIGLAWVPGNRSPLWPLQ